MRQIGFGCAVTIIFNLAVFYATRFLGVRDPMLCVVIVNTVFFLMVLLPPPRANLKDVSASFASAGLASAGLWIILHHLNLGLLVIMLIMSTSLVVNMGPLARELGVWMRWLVLMYTVLFICGINA
ncbi:hypothetical protein HZA85_01105 [Candidatus Uhrbacteria bacterium]|nr:hypothetical protein [Candidatus Uhrbacteria bacterium]